jgi:RNA polymerase primary sigma factor
MFELEEILGDSDCLSNDADIGDVGAGVEIELIGPPSSNTLAGDGSDSKKAGKHRLSTRREDALSPDPFNVYCRSVSRIRLLTREEEVRLAKEIETARINTLRQFSLTPISSARLNDLASELQPALPTKNAFLPNGAEAGQEAGGQVSLEERNSTREEEIGHILKRIRRLESRYLKITHEARHRRLSARSRARKTAEIKSCREAVFRALTSLDWTESQVDYLVRGLQDVLGRMERSEKDAGSARSVNKNQGRNLAAMRTRRVLETEDLTDIKELREILNRIHTSRAEAAHAKEQFVRANLRLVLSIARNYSYPGIDRLDLVQEGNIGMMKAVDKFNYRLGLKFSTYASWWIRQSITRAIADQGSTIRKPVHVVEALNRVRKVSNSLTQRMGRWPSLHELSDELQTSASRVVDILYTSQEMLSLEATICDNKEAILGNFIGDKSAASPYEEVLVQNLCQATKAALQILSPREREVICLRFGLNEMKREYTLQEIGVLLHVTRERIRQIEADALRRLRGPYRFSKLHEFASPSP